MSIKNTVIKTGATLASFLDNVISESVKSGLHQQALREKEKQASTSNSQNGSGNSDDDEGGDTDLFGTGSSDDDEGADEEVTSSKTMDDDTETMKKGDVEPKDVIDKLNSIRSGKSFKDDVVSAAMDEYVGSLSKAEKTALFTFLKGIAQIVTGEIPAQQAAEPDEKPADIAMKKGDQVKTKHVAPNVIKASPPKQKAQKGSEDTSSPVPITPKRK